MKPAIPMRTIQTRVVAAQMAVAALAMLATQAQAAEPARWQATKHEIRDKKNDVYLPRFSPDSRMLAYAVSMPSGEIAFAEIRRYSLSDRKTKVLFPMAEARKMADWGAYPMRIQWSGPNTLTADISNGDDGYNVYALKADRTGSLSYESFGAEDDDTPPKIDPALRVLVPEWPAPVFENAMQYMVRIRSQGALMQKRYAEQDDNLWWLDLNDKQARIALPEPSDAKLELMQGFAFGSYAVFALRRGDVVTAQRLDGDGHMQDIDGSRVQTNIGPDAIGTGVGAVDQRRCSETVCWAAYRIRRDERMDTRILRLERDGRVTLLEPIAGLEDFAVSPDFKRLAVSVSQDGKRTIKLFDIASF
jgi:hypothetical protein